MQTWRLLKAWSEYDLPWARISVVAGVVSIASPYVVQAGPTGPFGWLDAIYLSVAASFMWGMVCLWCACCALRRVDGVEKTSLLALSVLYLGAVLLVAGLVFVTVNTFVRPLGVWGNAFAVAIAACVIGAVGYGRLSVRGRTVLISRPVKQLVSVALWYVEVSSMILCVMIPMLPNEYRLMIAWTKGAFFTAPIPVALSYYLNRNVLDYGALPSRLCTYAISAFWMLFLWVFLPCV